MARNDDGYRVQADGVDAGTVLTEFGEIVVADGPGLFSRVYGGLTLHFLQNLRARPSQIGSSRRFGLFLRGRGGTEAVQGAEGRAKVMAERICPPFSLSE